MGLSTVTAPAFDPISLAEAKAHCRVTTTDEDGLIAGYILAARQFVENECFLRLATQTIDYTIDGDWPCVGSRGYYRQRIDFPIGPVQSITSVSYVDGSGATQTLSPSLYVTGNLGTAVQSGRPYIEVAYGSTWPVARCQPATITVRAVVGWDLSNVPNPLMQAMRMLIGHQYEIREAVNVGSTVTTMDYAIEAFLSPYRLTGI